MPLFEDLADGSRHRRIRVSEEWEPLGPGYERARDDFLAAFATAPLADGLIMCGGLLHNAWLGETVFPADDFYFIGRDRPDYLNDWYAVRKLKEIIQTVADGEPRGEGATRFQASGASARQTNRSMREDELEFAFEHGYPQYMLDLPWLDADGRSGRLEVEVWCETSPPLSDITAFPRSTGGDPIELRTETPHENLEHMLRFLLAPMEPAYGVESTKRQERSRAFALYSAALLAETLQARPETLWSLRWYTREHHEHLGSLRFEWRPRRRARGPGGRSRTTWPSDLRGTPDEYTRRLQAALAPLLDGA